MLNSVYLIATAAIGLLSMVMVWVFAIDTGRGIEVATKKSYSRYINAGYIFSLIMLVILWFTTEDIDLYLTICAWGFTGGWVITGIGILILSFGHRIPVNGTKMRLVALPCILRVIILLAVLWLFL